MRRVFGFVAASTLVAGSIAISAPVNAVVTTTSVSEATCLPADIDNETYNVPAGNNFEIAFTSCASNGLYVGSASSGSFASAFTQGTNDFYYLSGYFNAAGPMGGALGVGTYIVYFRNSLGSTAEGSFTIVVGGGGGDSPVTSSATAPALETLTLQVSTENTACTGGSPTGYSGSWLQLPAADACSQTGPDANPNAKLLGWATSPQFPVSVAQQIVDLKYGPIDAVIDGTRMIFIPAGGWTFVSGSNNLYPIWSS